MGDKNAATLAQSFEKITSRQHGVEGRRDHADFPEFLWLMKHLLDTNFGGIRERTNAANKAAGRRHGAATGLSTDVISGEDARKAAANDTGSDHHSSSKGR